MTPAHRRPGLVALVYAYRALAGVLIALPATLAVGGPVSGWPRGQAELFDPGGVMLVEALRLARRQVPTVAGSAAVLAALAILAGIFPLGALLAGLAQEGRLRASSLAQQAVAHAGTLALILGLGALLQAGVGGVVAVIGGRIIGGLHLEGPADDIAAAVLVAVVAVVVMIAGVLRDLASVAAVRGDQGFYAACTRALLCARRKGGRALLAWAWRAALGTGGIALATWLAPPLAGASAAAVAAGVMLHQGAILGATFARASWLAAAMRLYDAVDAAPIPKEEPPAAEPPAVEPNTEAATDPPTPAEPPPSTH